MKKLLILLILSLFVSLVAHEDQAHARTVHKKKVYKKKSNKKKYSRKRVSSRKRIQAKKKAVAKKEPVRKNDSNVELKSKDLNVRDADGALVCKVSPGDNVEIIAEHEDGKRYKVKISKKECPEEGFLSMDVAKFKGKSTDLEIVTDGNGPKKDCVNCDAVKDKAEIKDKNLEVVKDLKDKIKEDPAAQKNSGGSSSFVRELWAFIKNPKRKPNNIPVSRGLVQFPVKGNKGTVGPCGSVHYNPSSPKGIDVYANPLTACVFASVLQDWKKEKCPNNSGCTLQFGDISHKSNPCWNNPVNKRSGRCPSGSTHMSHTNGYCIDIRPLAKGGFNYGPLTYDSPRYDRAATKKLIEYFISQGADTDQLFFNDPKLIIAGKTTTVRRKGKTYKAFVKTLPKSDRSGVHDNHIHVCFKNNSKTKNICSNLKVDQEVCPELK